MHTVHFLQERIRQVFQEMELPNYPPELYEPIRYCLSMGGKRIRPLLTLLGCDLYGGDIEKAMSCAVALEIFHNFTLVHDDIMDHAPLRRGKETVYRKWNTNTAILSGDTMFALAYDALSETDTESLPEILKVFTQTAREVCEGQQLDLNFESMSQVSIPDYIGMIRLKTAVLLGCCLKIGSVVGKAGKHDADLLYYFGENAGIAFQIQDDLLDVFGEEESFGKKTGGDILAHKKTFLYLKAMEIALPEQYQRLRSLYQDSTMDPETKILLVKGIYTDLRVQEYANQEIDVYYHKALGQLKRVALPDSKKENLKGFMDKLMQRSY